MTTNAENPVAETEPDHRWWLPMTVLLVAAVALLGLMFLLPKDYDAGYRNAYYTLCGLVAMFGIAFWAVFLSRFSKRRVLGIIALMVALPALFLRVPGFYGNGIPKWELAGWVQRAIGIEAQQLLERNRLANKAAEGTVADLTDKPGDMPAYRGRARDGVVTGPAINADWEKNPPKLLWKQPVGLGWAAFSEANGFLVTIEQRREREVVACYEAKTGKEVWATGWETEFKEFMGGIGPRATPTIFEGDVYAYGAKGKLLRLKGTNGEIAWSADTLAEGQNLMWAMSGSPLVFDDKVIVCPGVQNGREPGTGILAFDRDTGKELWRAGDNQASYSSPMLATLDGIRQILLFDGAGCGGYDPADGRKLWFFPLENNPKVNAAQPVILGPNEVFLSSGYETGSVMLKIEKESLADAKESATPMKATEVYRPRFRDMRSKFATPVLHEGFLYGLNDGILECMDASTGKVAWKDDRRAGKGKAYGHGQILLCQGHLVITTEFGELVLVEANPKELVEKGRIDAIAGRPSWNNPCMADGIVYLRTNTEMAAYDLK